MLPPDRVPVQGTTPHQHEREAIEFVKKALPEFEPFRIWALFDLVDANGRRYEIDLLVLGYDALYHVELKGHPGRVSGDVVDWKFQFPEGGVSYRENPLRLAEHKSRVLASLLQRELGPRRPYVETLIFLSDANVQVDLVGAARAKVIKRADFLEAVQFGRYPGSDTAPRRARIDKPTARAVEGALKNIGIRPSKGALKVGAYAVEELLEEGPGYQDYSAKNERMPDLRRRVRSYFGPQATTAERREQLRRAAEREARILTAIGDHPGILRMTDYDAEGLGGGPCLLFEHFDDARPLDAFVRDNKTLSLDHKLSIIGQIGDALAYCHRKQVLHRGLSPGRVLVRTRPGSRELEAKLYNFQLAAEVGGSQGTVHLSQLGAEPSIIYRAPEVIEDPARACVESDVFSLGAIAYFLFTGRAPGSNLGERRELFKAGGGFLAVSALDDSFAEGASLASELDTRQRKSLDEVMRGATDENYLERLNDPLTWSQILYEELTAPEPLAPEEPAVDPLDARPGQQLGEYLVEKVLGSGATSRVLQVSKDNRRYALKVSRAPELDERLEAEARTLEKLGSDRIVASHGTRRIGSRLALLLEDAGETLADILAREGAQSLDFAKRWGEDLLLALRVLEGKQILHRDIKPANLGVPAREAKRTRNLFLFDFSLAELDVRRVELGTPAYRDPFVIDRKQWDEAADRFSAALTLYEILTGTRPIWGTGNVPASVSEGDMAIEAERFDSGAREGLLRFFKKAFARDARERHETAEAMRTDWLDCFRAAPSPIPEIEIAAIDYSSLDDSAPVQAIDGLSARAKNALDRAGAITVGDVVSLPPNQFSAWRGVGRDTQREILALVKALRATRPGLTNEAAFFPNFAADDLRTADLHGLSAAAIVSLESAGLTNAADIAATPRKRLDRVLARVPNGLEQLERALREAKRIDHTATPRTLDDWVHHCFPATTKHDQYVRELFGIDEAPGGGYAKGSTELAKRHRVKQPNMSIALAKAREAWRADAALAPLFELVLSALGKVGGLASLDRLATIALEPLPNDGTAEAQRRAAALVRVVAEANPELSLGRVGERAWVARAPEHFTLARLLGEAADELAAREPLPSFEQARDELGRLLVETPLAGVPAERLVGIAADASTKAALSARLELYPRGMSADRAVRLSAGALASARITPEQIRRVVQLRYPAAEPLPFDDSSLAKLLAPLGLERRGDQFERPGTFAGSTHSTEAIRPRSTLHSSRGRTSDPKEQENREFEERLRTAARNRSFRVLEVDAVFADHAAPRVSHLLGVQPTSLEREILKTFDQVLVERGVTDASVVVDTDRKGPDGSEDWAMLTELLDESARRAVTHLSSTPGTLLLTDPGILGRYSLAAPLHLLLAATERDHGPGIFLLLPTYSEASLTPVIDAIPNPLPVPLSSPGQRLRVPRAWVAKDGQ